MTVRVVPFRLLLRRLASRAPAQVPRDPAWPAAVRRAVERGGRTVPGATCLVQSLAGLTMLRRGGHRAVWRLGVRGGDAFSAHAWVECNGVLVAGDTDHLGSYQQLYSIDDAATAARG